MKFFCMCLLILNGMYSLGAYAHSTVQSNKQINALLDGFHTAASNADLQGYLGSFTNTGVFMGTDDWERWSRPITLDKYITEKFAGGSGWTYKSVERHINFSPDNKTAWFDEITMSKKWGRFRGTGVVVKQHGHWKIAHYALSFLVPNEAWENVSTLSTKGFAERNNTQ